MIPTIYVFSEEWIQPWESVGYQVFFDQVHQNDEEWFRRQLKGNFLLVTMDGERFIDKVVPGPYRYFIVVPEPVTEEMWEEVQGPGEVSWFDKPDVLKGGNDVKCVSHPPQYEPITEPYEFETYYIEERDTMLYTVKRPGTAEPYTVVVFPWKEKGHEAFFTDIYGARSWDHNRMECRFDFSFLQECWKRLHLPNEFTIDLVKEKIARCYPREGIIPEAEPKVYRRGWQEVVETLARRDRGQ